MEPTVTSIYDSKEKCLLNNCTISNFTTFVHNLENETEEVPVEGERQFNVSKSRICSYCCVEFGNTIEQRAHYKLDWHRYNIKQVLLGKNTVSEEIFDNTADDVSSISGSESDSSDDETPSDSTSELRDEDERKLNCFRDAKIFVENPTGDALSFYKCLLLGRRDSASQPVLQNMLQRFLRARKKWLIVMLGGGHFAAAVFDNGELVEHKTYHKYTVRAKQGGSQASHDNRGACKSAGASLRRYNELALSMKVQEILGGWAHHIGECTLILHRAVGPHNKKILFGGKTPPLDKSDGRLRNVPFTTRRATLKEIKRVHDMLSSVECHGPMCNFKKHFETDGVGRQSSEVKELSKSLKKHLNIIKKSPSPTKVDRAKERALPNRDIPEFTADSGSSGESIGSDLEISNVEVNLSDLKEFQCSCKPKRRKKPTTKQKTNAEKRRYDEEMDRLQSRMRSLCASDNAAGLQKCIVEHQNLPVKGSDTGQTNEETSRDSILRKEDFMKCLNAPLSEETGDTLLHLASGKHFPDIVSLLLNAGSDPTIKNRRGQVPYLVSGDKETKAAFKEFAWKNPERFDQKLTFIPSAPTPEQQAIQEEKKKEKRKQKKTKEKEKKKESYERKINEDDRVRFLALSDREKRAVAAEKRLVSSLTDNAKNTRTPVLVRCFQCGSDITGKVPFEYSTHLFCTISCLKSHRAKTNSYGVEI